jgi:hypothetical protein
MSFFSDKDKKIVGDLARHLTELAAGLEQAGKIAEWKRHNALKPGKSMVLQAPEGVWGEFVPDTAILCDDPFARSVESRLRMQLYKEHHIHDDQPFTTEFYTPIFHRENYYEIKRDTDRSPDAQGVNGAEHYNCVLNPGDDLDAIFTPRVLERNDESTQEYYEKACELVGGILDVSVRGQSGSWFAILDEFIQWRGLENMMFDMIDNSEWLHDVLQRMTDVEIDRYRQFEALNMLGLNNGNNSVASGGIGLTDELPSAGFDGKVRLIDQWGHATTQIFSEVSPAMHDEFAIRYEAQFLEAFGLNCYGCCEPLHKKIHLVDKLPRMRRVSMSPWCDHVEGCEQVGNKYIYSVKPNPAFLCTGTFDLAPCREEIVTVLDAAKANGCIVEFVMKDTHTCCEEPQRYDQWSELALQLCEDYA